MQKRHYEFYYNNKLNGEEKAKCDKITHGEDFDNLTLNQKMKLTLICINDKINFFADDSDETVVFNSGDDCYKLLNEMDEDEWEIYLEIMASRGVTVVYDSVEDVYEIS